MKTRNCSACTSNIGIEDDVPERCPECGALYWDKPVIERKLFEIQDRYFDSDQDTEILGELYEVLMEYSRNMILSRIRNKYQMPADELFEKSSDAASKIVEKILSTGNGIDNSFGGYLGWVVNGVLYGSKKDDESLSLNFHMYDGGELADHLEAIGYLHSSHEDMDFENRTLNEDTRVPDIAFSIVEKSYHKISESPYSRSEPLLFLCALRNRLYRHHEKFMDKFYESFGNVIRDDVRKVELLLMHYLQQESANG